MSTGAEVTKKGISRRDLIKKGAVAGAVFWSVPVIESITSAASATSGGVFCGASWVFVIYKNISTGTYYFTSWAKNSSVCGSQGSHHCNYTDTTGALGHLIGQDGSSIVFPDNNSPEISVNGGAYITTQDCTGVTQSGDTITAKTGYTIVAVSAFTGSKCYSSGAANQTASITINGSGSGNSTNVSFDTC